MNCHPLAGYCLAIRRAGILNWPSPGIVDTRKGVYDTTIS